MDITNYSIAPDTDLSIRALQKIFSGAGPLNDIFGIWNAAMMMVATVIIGYIVIAGVLKSAHEGEVLGKKWSTMWVPARAGIGLTMTAPVVAGFSVVQLLVLWVAAQGVGIADLMWAGAADKLAKNGGLIQQPALTQQQIDLFGQVYLSAACAASMNREVAASQALGDIQNFGSSRVQALAYEKAKNKFSTADMGFVEIGFAIGSLEKQLREDECGKFVWSRDDAHDTGHALDGFSGASSFATEYREQGEQFILGQRNALIVAYNSAYQLIANATATDTRPSLSDMQLVLQDYQVGMGAITSVVTKYAGDQGLKGMQEAAAKDGWAMAGAYFSRIGHLNAAAQQVIRQAPTSVGADVEWAAPVQQDIEAAAIDFDRLRESTVPGAVSQGRDLSSGETLGPLSHPLLSLQRTVLAAFSAESDPFTRMQNLGHYLLDAGWTLLTIKTVIDVAPTGKVAKLAGKVAEKLSGLGAIGSIISPLIALMFLLGAILAYVLPMVPALLLLFAVMAWLTSVFIAVVAAPLWAISHATPDGHEAFGSGSNGYVLLMSVALRPSLTILAMFGSYAILFAMDAILNPLYSTAFAGGQINSTTGLIGFLVSIFLYVLTSIAIVYGSFRLIQTIPDAVLQWIGGRDDDAIGVERSTDKVYAAAMMPVGHRAAMSGLGKASPGRAAQTASNSSKDNNALLPGKTNPTKEGE